MLNNEIRLPHTQEKNFAFHESIQDLLIFTVFVGIPVCFLMILIKKYDVLN
jgi:hypothetical protein